MQVSELMSKTIQTIDASATLNEAAQIMRSQDVGILPVSDGGVPTAMLTDRDIVIRAVAENKDPSRTKVRDIVSDRICLVYVDQDVREAAAIMANEQVRRLLVLDQDQKAVGIVSLGDLARHAPSDATETAVEGASRA